MRVADRAGPLAASEAEHVDRPDAAARGRAGRCRPPPTRPRAPSARRRQAPRHARGTPPAPTSACSPTRARRRRRSAGRRSRIAPSASTSRSAPSSAWPPVTITAPGPWASSASPSSRRRRPLPQPRQRPRLGQVRRDHPRPRQHPLDQRRLRGGVEQRGAARRDHHRVDHDRRVAHQLERLEHGIDRRLVGEHPDLDRVDAEVGGDRAHLGDDHLRRHGRDHLDARRCSARSAP